MERNGGNVKSEAANPPRMKGRPAPHGHRPSSAPRAVRPGRAPPLPPGSAPGDTR